MRSSRLEELEARGARGAPPGTEPPKTRIARAMATRRGARRAARAVRARRLGSPRATAAEGRPSARERRGALAPSLTAALAPPRDLGQVRLCNRNAELGATNQVTQIRGPRVLGQVRLLLLRTPRRPLGETGRGQVGPTPERAREEGTRRGAPRVGDPHFSVSTASGRGLAGASASIPASMSIEGYKAATSAAVMQICLRHCCRASQRDSDPRGLRAHVRLGG
jgi:hypothetical protein